MLRRILPLVVALGLGVGVPAADAAPKKTTKLYFGNIGEPEDTGCTKQFMLLTRQQDGGECTSNLIAYKGNGLFNRPESYSSKTSSFKLDVTRPLTGTVYVQSFPLLTGGVGPVALPQSNPTQVELSIVYKLDTTTIGTQQIAGLITTQGALAAPFSFKLPASLRNKTARKVTALVTWSTTVGLTGITYTAPYASVISVPVR